MWKATLPHASLPLWEGVLIALVFSHVKDFAFNSARCIHFFLLWYLNFESFLKGLPRSKVNEAFVFCFVPVLLWLHFLHLIFELLEFILV